MSIYDTAAARRSQENQAWGRAVAARIRLIRACGKGVTGDRLLALVDRATDAVVAYALAGETHLGDAEANVREASEALLSGHLDDEPGDGGEADAVVDG